MAILSLGRISTDWPICVFLGALTLELLNVLKTQ